MLRLWKAEGVSGHRQDFHSITRNTGRESRLSTHLQKFSNVRKEIGKYQPNPSTSQKHDPEFTSENPGSHPISKPQVCFLLAPPLPLGMAVLPQYPAGRQILTFQAEPDASWGSLACRTPMVSALFPRLSQMGHGSEEGWLDTSGTCGKLAKLMGKTGNKNGGGSYGEEEEQVPVLRVSLSMEKERVSGPRTVLSKWKHCPPFPAVMGRWPCHPQN